MKKHVEELKAQSDVIEKQKAQKIEEELKKTVATNKVLHDDKIKLLEIIKNFKKVLVEQVEERLVNMS